MTLQGLRAASIGIGFPNAQGANGCYAECELGGRCYGRLHMRKDDEQLRVVHSPKTLAEHVADALSR